MLQNEQQKDPFEIMEHNLLPVFKEAVSIAKKVSHNPNYFKGHYSKSRKLYAMSIVSLVINLLNADNNSDEQKKRNIKMLDVYQERPYYNADGSSRVESIFYHPEIIKFTIQMNKLRGGYFEDVVICRCVESFKLDSGMSAFSEGQPIISPDGKILDWKRASKSAIFEFAVRDMVADMYSHEMERYKKLNEDEKMRKVENFFWRKCEETINTKIAESCSKRQGSSVVGFMDKGGKGIA